MTICFDRTEWFDRFWAEMPEYREVTDGGFIFQSLALVVGPATIESVIPSGSIKTDLLLGFMGDGAPPAFQRCLDDFGSVGVVNAMMNALRQDFVVEWDFLMFL